MLGGLAASAGALTIGQSEAAPQIGRDGLWIEDFYRPTSASIPIDLANASAEGKVLSIFWERAGCEYCAMLHLVALQDPDIRDFMARRFFAVRLNFYGNASIVDLDGRVLKERDLAVRHGVTGTPTMEFRIADGREVYRIPGYAEPPVLGALFDYVYRGGYLGMSDAAWLSARGLT